MDLPVIRTGSVPGLERIVNLSRCGARLRSHLNLAEGSRHTFLMVLPGEDEPVVVPVRARVVWAHAGMAGLAFLGTDPRVAAFVDSLARFTAAPELRATSY